MVLINIPLPPACPICPCSHYNQLGHFAGCEAVPDKWYAAMEDPEYTNSSGKPEWCPMKEVQE